MNTEISNRYGDEGSTSPNGQNVDKIRIEDVNLIQLIADEFNEALNKYRDEVPKLISADKPMTAIDLINDLDSKILESHALLSRIYKSLLNYAELLEDNKSIAFERFKKTSFEKTMFSSVPIKTYGYYEIGGTFPNDFSEVKLICKLEDQLGRDAVNSAYPKGSNVRKIFFAEMLFYFTALRSVVENGWAVELNETGSNSDRYIRKEVRLEVWRRDRGRCVECGSQERLEYDHILPISKGGSNTARNIQLLCEYCNRSKSDKIDG